MRVVLYVFEGEEFLYRCLNAIFLIESGHCLYFNSFFKQELG